MRAYWPLREPRASLCPLLAAVPLEAAKGPACWLAAKELQREPSTSAQSYTSSGSARALAVNILAGLAKARHPATKAAAKAASQAPAKREARRKRSCGAGRPARARASGGESASLRKGASILASLRNGPNKKQSSPEEPRALPLRPISACKRCGEAARAQSPARRGRLGYIAGFSPRRRQDAKEALSSASQPQQLRPAPPCLAPA